MDLLDGALGPPEATPALAGPRSPGREVVCVGRGPPWATYSVACPPRRSPASSWLLGAGPPPRQGHAPPGIPGRELRERPPLQALLQVGGVWLLAWLALSPYSSLHLINDFSGRFGETFLAEKLLFVSKRSTLKVPSLDGAGGWRGVLSQLHALCCSRQGHEDPHWQYPAATYGDNHAYQSHQRQPAAWQGDRGTPSSSGSGDRPLACRRR